jgi:tetratricopeptide (TPR) repeat protein
MELTIEQALQQGVAAHNQGDLQEAERLYRAILESQPTHSDANHNLGVLAVSVNQVEAALPLFKIALDANPKIEQFWLSYIDALIKENQIKNAKRAIKKANKKGFSGDKLNALSEKLYSEAQAVNVSSANPPQQQLDGLLEHYQNGRFDEAEKLAISITQSFPTHNFSWKILAAVFKKTGRNSEAVNANQTAVELSPQDAESHSNLGIMLQDLGELEKAEASYRQAIGLKPDYAEAHSNLGVTLQGLGRLDEAEASLTQAIALKSDFAQAHYNLGITLQEQGRLEEAEASYRAAIALKSNYAEAHSNLGGTLQELGRVDEAEASYRQAIALKPDHVEALSNLGNTLNELGRLDEAEASYRQAIICKPDYAVAYNNLGGTLRELGRLGEAEACYTQAIALKPDYDFAHNSLLRCLYLQDKHPLFFDELDYLINQDKANAVIGSLTCRSALKYGLKKQNLFCREPLKYVFHTDLNTQCDFAEIFVEKAKDVLSENRLSNRHQSLLVNGYQTSGNLFEIENSFTENIQKAIRLAIEKYRANFKNSEEGLIKRWPSEYSLYGWLISMKSGGELQPHIHEQGWLSGSVYINVPSKTKANGGNLVVSVGEDNDATDTRVNLKKIINVVTGSLVLFPASLTHNTIPFEAEEERIVLAFDVKQK